MADEPASSSTSTSTHGKKKGGFVQKYKWQIIGGLAVIAVLVFYFVRQSNSNSASTTGTGTTSDTAGTTGDTGDYGSSGYGSGGDYGGIGATGPAGATGATGATGPAGPAGSGRTVIKNITRRVVVRPKPKPAKKVTHPKHIINPKPVPKTVHRQAAVHSTVKAHNAKIAAKK